ncbi:hypothetical protein ACOQFO_13700 [Ureibacillus sp. MALMAid1270]|uniref:hypothetical protein n=1 Tax=Ureibacillus sp. MALMAid1270 TaxID=3411629 RepID=UPI003BA5B142
MYNNQILPENELFLKMKGKNVLLVTKSNNLNILGQVFKPIFTGKVAEVTNGFITLNPVIIKMHNAPFYKFPTPLSFPIENISTLTPFDPNRKFLLINLIYVTSSFPSFYSSLIHGRQTGSNV